MKCANCEENAVYVYTAGAIEGILYCYHCLPYFLREQARAGVLGTTPEFNAIQDRLMTKMLPE